MRRGEAVILEAISGVLDAVNQLSVRVTALDERVSRRLDTLIDTVAELRHDFDTHTHGGESHE